KERMFMFRRGNLQQDLYSVGEEASEGTEIQSVSLFKLMKVFEKVMQRLHDRQNAPQHVVYRYNYTMEETREFVLGLSSREKTLSFEKMFDVCQDRVHAIFIFLSVLELVQQRFMTIIVGEGRNNFILEYNENRFEEEAETVTE
ncbi:MAG: chromosome segregation protein ScpA, partial [Chitinophagaceae bacterium]